VKFGADAALGVDVAGDPEGPAPPQATPETIIKPAMAVGVNTFRTRVPDWRPAIPGS